MEYLASTGITLPFNGPVIIFGLSVWILFSIMTGFAIWTHYYLDLWIVTDRRIISVDQIHFFNRNVAIFRLERLQDIEYKIKGILPTFLNFELLALKRLDTMITTLKRPECLILVACNPLYKARWISV